MISRLKPKSEFARNVLTLMTGTTIAQSIPIAISPVLTRIYTPEDFGLLALYMALFSILSIIATGRYEFAILAPESESEAKSIVYLSVLISFCVFGVTSVLVWLLNDEISALLGNPEIGRWLYFIPFTVFSFGIYQSIDFWLNRHRKYRDMAGNKLIQAGSVSLAQVMLGFITNAGLILGSVVGWTFSILLIIRKNKLNYSDFNFDSVKKLAVEYKDYPLLQAPSSLLNSLSMQAPIFFMTRFFDAIAVGFFSFVLKILGAPTALIAQSTGQVFFQRVSEHAKDSPELLINDIYRVALRLSILSVITFLPVFLFGPELFSIVFGSEWSQAGAYAQILVFAVAVKFVVSPLSTVFLAIGKIAVVSTWQFIHFLTTFLVLFIAVRFDTTTFLWLYVCSEVVMYLLYFILMVYTVRSFVFSGAR